MNNVSFNSATYKIYGMKDGFTDSPLSAESPREELGSKNHKFVGNAVLGAVGFQTAQKAIGALRSEIGLSTGDESLQAEFNNILTGITMISAVIATHGAAAIGYAAQGVTDAILYSRNITRMNHEISYNNKLRGARMDITGVIYD